MRRSKGGKTPQMKKKRGVDMDAGAFRCCLGGMDGNKGKPEPSCCNLRALSFCVGVTFLLVQLGLLAVSFLFIVDPEHYVNQVMGWVDDRGITVPEPLSGMDRITKNLGDYMAIPVLVNSLLIISDILLIWAAASRRRLLLWPWLVLHVAEFLFFITCLVVFMVIAGEPWLKVVIFLVGCPVIVLLGFFCFVVKCFHMYLGDLRSKQMFLYEHPPSTVYTPDPHQWDHPIPVWAEQPIWDPDSIKAMDPRYSGASNPSKRRISHLMQTLPDGTLVVPIIDVEEVEHYRCNSSQENSSEELDAHSSTSHRRRSHRGDGVVGTRSISPVPEDRTSVISLSDKYRNHEEIEVYQEHYHYKPPPEPVRPNFG